MKTYQTVTNAQELNDAIARLVSLCQETGAVWVDTLPLSRDMTPVLYLSSYSSNDLYGCDNCIECKRLYNCSKNVQSKGNVQCVNMIQAKNPIILIFITILFSHFLINLL